MRAIEIAATSARNLPPQVKIENNLSESAKADFVHSLLRFQSPIQKKLLNTLILSPVPPPVSARRGGRRDRRGSGKHGRLGRDNDRDRRERRTRRMRLKGQKTPAVY